MINKLCLVSSVILTTTMFLAACESAATPKATATATAALVPSTTVPVATAGARPNAASIKVGLVTNIAGGGVKDQAFNQMAWEGLQKAAKEIGFQAKFIESKQPTDYEKNIEVLATDGYTVIITVGPSMGDATALKAKQYPQIKFAIIDNAYAPTNSSQYCSDTVQDCYTDGGLTNITSLMFAEEQMGFLAGVLAGGMSKSGFVCSISSTRTPASDRYVINFRAGAVWQAGENHIRSMNNYINIQTTDKNIPAFTDATQGKETALKLIGNGCDVVFGIGANGALLAAKERNLMAIGVDVDQYNTNPEVQSALISSAMKRVDVAVYYYLKTVADGTATAGISIASLQNGGIGLASFHDWDSAIPAELKAQIQKVSDGIKDGSIVLSK